MTATFTYTVGFLADTKDLTEKIRLFQSNLQSNPIKLKTELPGLGASNIGEAQKAITAISRHASSIDEIAVKTQKLRTESGKTYTEITGLVVKWKDAQGHLVTSTKDVANNITGIKSNMGLYDEMGKKATDWANRAEKMGKTEKEAIQSTSLALRQKIGEYKQLVEAGKLKQAAALSPLIQKLNTEFEAQVSLSKRAATGVQGWAASIATAIKNTISYTFSLGLVREAQQKLHEAIQFTIELNKEMINVQVLQAEGAQTDEEIASLARSFNQLAINMGSTTVEIAKGSVEWLRQGKTIEETSELLKASTMLSKLGNLSAAEATEYLTSTVNSYKIAVEDTLEVVDRLVAVDNTSATSTKELATALRYSAASAAQAGVSLEKLISYIGVVSSVTRINAESVGQAFKTIFARMQDIKAGQIDEDGLGLNNVESALARVDIKLRDSTTSFRDMSTVLEDLAGKWDTLTEVEQANLAKAIAGVRQQNMFSVLMTNMNEALRLQEAQYNSTGLAVDRYGIYLNSVEASQNKAKASLENLYLSFKNFDSLLITINNLTAGIADFLVKAGGLPVIITTLISLFIAFNTTAIASAAKAVAGLAINIVALISKILPAIPALNGLRAAILGLNLSLASTGWGLAIVAVGALIAHLIWLSGAEERASENTKRLREEFKELSNKLSTLNNEKDKVNELWESYEKLGNITNKTTEQKKEYYDIQSELIRMFPTIQSYYSEEGKLILDESVNLKLLIDLKNKEIEATKISLELKAKETTEDAVRKYTELSNTLSEYQRQKAQYEASIGTAEELFFSAGDIEKNIKETEKKLKEAQAPIITYFSTLGRESKDAFLNSLISGGKIDIYKAILEALGKSGGGTSQKISGDMSDILKITPVEKDSLSYYDTLTKTIAEYRGQLDSLVDLQKKESLTVKDIADAKTLGLDVYIDEAGRIKITKESIEEYRTLLKKVLEGKIELDDKTRDMIDSIDEEAFSTEKETYTLDKFISAQSTVNSALEEYNENGEISISTAMNMAQAGYAGALSFDAQTGAITISNEALRELQLAQLDLARTTAEANLARAKDTIGTSIAIIEAYEAEISAINMLKITLSNLGEFQPIELSKPSGGGGGGGGSSKVNEAAIKAKEEEIKEIEKVIKGLEKQKDALKELQDQYDDYINQQKELLKLKKEEDDYNDEIKEKNKNLAKIQTQIAELALDNSEEARARRLELEAEAAKIETDIAETKEDRKYDLQVNALDKLKDDFDKLVDSQIKAIDRVIEKHREEIEAIREVIEALREAQGSGSGGGGGIKEYSKVSIEAINNIISKIKEQYGELAKAEEPMKAIIKHWLEMGKTAEFATEKAIEYFEAYSGRWGLTNPETGEFQKPRAIPQLSKGGMGIIPEGYPNDGYPINVESGELIMVLNKQQQQWIKNPLSMLSQITQKTPATSSNINRSGDILLQMPITVEGNLDSSTLPEIKKIANEVVNQINKTMLTRGYLRTSNQTIS